MSNISFSKTFSVNIPSINLNDEANITFRLVLDTPSISEFTASFSSGARSGSNVGIRAGKEYLNLKGVVE